MWTIGGVGSEEWLGDSRACYWVVKTKLFY